MSLKYFSSLNQQMADYYKYYDQDQINQLDHKQALDIVLEGERYNANQADIMNKLEETRLKLIENVKPKILPKYLSPKELDIVNVSKVLPEKKILNKNRNLDIINVSKVLPEKAVLNKNIKSDIITNSKSLPENKIKSTISLENPEIMKISKIRPELNYGQRSSSIPFLAYDKVKQVKRPHFQVIKKEVLTTLKEKKLLDKYSIKDYKTVNSLLKLKQELKKYK